MLFQRGLQSLIFIFSFIIVFFLLFFGINSSINVFLQRELFVFSLLLLWLLYEIQSGKKTLLYSYFFLLVSITFLYYFTQSNSQALLGKGVFGINIWDTLALWSLIITILWCTARKVGTALTVLCSLFILYAFWGKYIPGLWGHRGYTFTYIANYVGWTLEGIFSTPIAAVVNFVGLYVLFGELLDVFGAGKLFIDISYRFTSPYKGGTAQAAILSSALMGSINGSAVANVVTTGTFTIPLMKKVGYKPEYAAGVEAVASTGGQIAPPVMGAAAFVMADFTGFGYQTILVAALLPALLYYLSLFFSVYFHALAHNLQNTESIPSVLKHKKGELILLIPLVLLLYLLLVKGYSPQYSVLFSMALIILIGTYRTIKKEGRFPFYELGKAILNTAKILIMISGACMAAGIVIGIVNMTGIGIQFTQAIFSLAGESFLLLLIFVMIACLILGMGLPSTAAYCIVALVAAPALMEYGIHKLTAHLFVFYFAIISFITPPIGIASYAAASIAQSEPIKTALQAFLLGLAGFIIPFLIIYRPNLLLQNGFSLELCFDIIFSCLALLYLSFALEGWFLNKLKAQERFAFLCLAVVSFYPHILINFFALAIGIIIYIKITINKKI